MPPPDETPNAKIVRLEAAAETILSLVGWLTNEILKEEAQLHPDRSKINAFRAQKETLLHERRAINPDNQALLDRTAHIYEPIVKALHSPRVKPD